MISVKALIIGFNKEAQKTVTEICHRLGCNVLYHAHPELTQACPIETPDLIIAHISNTEQLSFLHDICALFEESNPELIVVADNEEANLFNETKSLHPSAFLLEPCSPLQISYCIELTLQRIITKENQAHETKSLNGLCNATSSWCNLLELVPIPLLELDLISDDSDLCKAGNRIQFKNINKAGLDFFNVRNITEFSVFAAEFLNAFHDLISPENGTSAIQVDIVTPDNESKCCLMRCAAIDPNHSHFFISVSEITQLKQTEKALASSEASIRLITDAIPALISYIDKDLIYRFVNKTFESWYMRSPADIIGTSVKELHGPEFYSKIEEYTHEALNGKIPSYEIQKTCFDGKTRNLKVNLIPHFDGVGRILGYAALVTDVTDFKLIEHAYKESELRYRTLSEASPDAIFVMDKLGRFQYANSGICKNFKKPLEQVLGRTESELFGNSEIFNRHTEAINNIVEKGTSISIDDYYNLPNGPMWVETRLVPLFDESGEVKQILGVSRDITERKLNEQALADSEKRFRALVETIPYGIVEIDLEGSFTFSNKANAAIFECESSELIGRKLWEFLPDDLSAKIKSNFEPYEPVESPSCWTGTILTAKNSSIDVKVDWDYKFDNYGKESGIIAILTDITELNIAARKLDRANAKYKSLIEQIPAITYIVPLLDHSSFYISPQVETMLGLSSEDLQRNPDLWLAHVYPPDRDKIQIDINSFRDGSLVTEYRMITKSGDILWFRDHSVRVPSNDEAGDFIQGVMFDITDLKLAAENDIFHEFIIENASDEIFLVNEDAEIVYMNSSALNVLGYDSSSSLHVQDIDPNYTPTHWKRLWRETRKSRSFTLESFHKTQEGRTFPVEVILNHLTYNNQEFICAFVRDVTIRKQVEEALKASESKLRMIMENLPVGSMLIDTKTNNISLNRAAEKIIGWKRSEIETLQNWFDKVFAQDKNSISKIYQDHRNNNISQPRIVTAKHKNGSTRFLEFSGRFYEHYEIWVIVDVTDRQLAEEALAEREQKYRYLVKNSPIGIMSFNHSGIIEEVNPEVLNILGLDDEKAITKHNILEFPEFISSGFTNDFMHCLQTSNNVVAEKSFQSRHGKTMDLRMHISPIIDLVGKLRGVQVILEDTTERRKHQERLIESERLKAIGVLAGGVAHNFNNLLQIVMGNAQLGLMYLENGEFADLRTNIQQIVESCKFGSGIVKRLQTFARGTTENMIGKNTVFDLSDIARQAIEMTRPMWKNAPEKEGISIRLSHQITEGCTVEGNQASMFEVLVNLIKNSVESMPNGGHIKVTTKRVDEIVQLKVTDTGIGIPEENLRLVFEPFFTTKGVQSSGMGLSSSFGIVKAHNGTMSVDSTLGKQTIFTVSIPFTQMDSPVETVAESLDVKRLRILAIDDLQAILSFLERGLSKKGHHVITATNGPDAIKLFAREKFDVIICDLGMPMMNGWDVGHKLKESSKMLGISKIPFILLTGWGEQVSISERIAHSGVDAIVQKPVNINKLMEVVQQFLHT